MYIGKTYRFFDFLRWTRRSIYWLIVFGTVPVLLYEVVGWKWIAIPWPVVALLGTATAFIVGFKNVQTYNRTWEARQIWGAAMGASRSWALMCRDLIGDSKRSTEIIYRHFAWLTALRYQLRTSKSWESIHKSYTKEFTKYYSIPEKETPLEVELSKYISKEEIAMLCTKNNKAAQLLSIQSNALKELYTDGILDNFRLLAMHGSLREFMSLQGKSERIKNFPYPRQYATVNSLFVKLFCLLLPFALLEEFNAINETVVGMMNGNMIWLVIPFSVLISWIYTSLEQVGESTENPFEGNANDVPISQMSRTVEIDIREMLGEVDLPGSIEVRNGIVM